MVHWYWNKYQNAISINLNECNTLLNPILARNLRIGIEGDRSIE